MSLSVSVCVYVCFMPMILAWPQMFLTLLAQAAREFFSPLLLLLLHSTSRRLQLCDVFSRRALIGNKHGNEAIAQPLLTESATRKLREKRENCIDRSLSSSRLVPLLRLAQQGEREREGGRAAMTNCSSRCSLNIAEYTCRYTYGYIYSSGVFLACHGSITEHFLKHSTIG